MRRTSSAYSQCIQIPGKHPGKGFTLVEIIVSLVTFTAIIVIFASSVILAEKTAYVNGQYAQALSLAQHKIDQLRAVGYGRLSYEDLYTAEIIDEDTSSQPYTFNGVDNIINDPGDPSDDLLPSATTALTIVQRASGSVPNSQDTKTVTVTITWKPANHNSKVNSLQLKADIVNVE